MRGQALTAHQRLNVLEQSVAMPDSSLRGIARAMGAPVETVRAQVARWEPVASELRTHKKDLLLGTWQWIYLDTLADLTDRRDAGTLTPRDRQTLVWTMGVATDKIQVLAGLPTAIVAGMHDVRLSVPELADRLAGIARRVRVDGKRLDDKGLTDPAISLSGRRPGDDGTEASPMPDREEGR